MTLNDLESAAIRDIADNYPEHRQAIRDAGESSSVATKIDFGTVPFTVRPADRRYR